MKKVIAIFLCLSISSIFTACSDGVEVETTTTTQESLISSEVSEETTTITEPTNPNNLPIYVAPDCVTPESILPADFEVSDEFVSELLEVGVYPYRTSYAFGFDSKFTTDYLTTYMNEKLDASYELVTVDDLNFYNTNHYYIKPEIYDGDAVNRLIWFSYFSNSFSCDFDQFMVNRAILISLDLVPMVNTIPTSYIEKYLPLSNEITSEEFDRIMDDWLLENGNNLTPEEDTLVNVVKYNISFYDILNWRYNVSIGRDTSGNICCTMSPASTKYQGVIDGWNSLCLELNTIQMYDPESGREVRVIVKDTPEYFEELFGRTYESVLEEYGLPLNPEI